MKHKLCLLGVLLMAFCAMAKADTTETIFEEFSSPSPTEKEWKFNVSPFSIEHQVRLMLDARIDWPDLGGSNPWLRVAVNGNYLTKENLLNKRQEFVLQKRGLDMTWSTGDSWRVLFSPNFEDAINSGEYAPENPPYHYVWDITRLVNPGENTLRIENLKVLPQPTTMILRDAKVEVGKAIAPPPAEEVLPAPTGPLPTFVADGKTQRLPLQVLLADDGGLAVKAASQTFSLSTRTSLPNGQWRVTAGSTPGLKSQTLKGGQSGNVNWKTAQYDVQREVKVLADHVHISDTFTNRTPELIGVMVSHHLSYPSPPEKLLVAGRPAQVATASSLSIAEHPSVFAQWPQGGVGLIAEDDVFRVHVKSFNDAAGMGLADEQLGIPAGESVTLEWNIYPAPKTASSAGDYWDFVNAVRRDWGSNYTIPGPFGFLPRFKADKPASWYADWARSRGLEIVCGSIAVYPDGKYAHGTGITFAPEWVANEKAWIAKMHAAAPEVKVLAYFHAQANTEPDGETKYADSHLLNEKGEHIGYPFEYRVPLYLPTRENSYGKALWKYVHTALDEMKVDGLYWDEMTASVLLYAQPGPWDNRTVIINPQTHAVIGKRTSVPLVMQPLQLEIAKYLRERGKYLMANGQPMTRTLLREKIVRFVECQSYQRLLDTHFACPLGLGNHFLEKNQADTARHIRDMLQYGALYYADTIYQEKPPTWPFVSVMFPLTPVELRAGMVLGKERIQTAKSGRFGWPDGAAAEVYVIDANGLRVEKPQVKEVRENGKRLYEIRMPSDHFAVLVKK
jgi:hypothetical protein